MVMGAPQQSRRGELGAAVHVGGDLCAGREGQRIVLLSCRWMQTVGALPLGFLTCNAPKQKAAELRQTRCPRSILCPISSACPAQQLSDTGDKSKAGCVSGQEERPLQAFTWRSGDPGISF